MSESQHFINEVCEWLLANNDPRLSFKGRMPVINDVTSACADFCKYMVVVTEAGFEASRWREYHSISQMRKQS